ncbi:hypothetical protein [Bacteroides acidifaciens]|uniref:DNA ligase LigA-related protein n=1 Tax=Bacteroides acidifaciens TaxID=85831 RepID=UPI00255817C0|nr:hypothetical protein [Bacteroides acidifaciens]
MDNNFRNHQQIYELIKRRRNQILVHSYIYFRLFDNIISDETFDKWANELIDLQKQYPDISSQVELYETFKSFTSVGCSSMLPLDNEKLATRAYQLLNEHHKRNSN